MPDPINLSNSMENKDYQNYLNKKNKWRLSRQRQDIQRTAV